MNAATASRCPATDPLAVDRRVGVIATVANGMAPILVGLFGWAEARILFAFMVGIAIWLLLAAVWPPATVRALEARRAAPA